MPESNEKKAVRYCIDVEGAGDQGRDIKPMIVSRMGYVTRQSLTPDVVAEMEAEDLIQQVAYQAGDDRDFLLPDTPLKESIFRVLLANENRPMTVEQVSEALNDKWQLSPYPRDTSPRVIERLMASSGGMYCIVAVPPEQEEDDEGNGTTATGSEE